MLIYGIEVCPLDKSDLRALDFVVDRFFMKLFQTGNIEVVSLLNVCLVLRYLAFSLKNVAINFIRLSSGNIISQCCQLFNLIVFSLFSFIVFVICLLYCYQLW